MHYSQASKVAEEVKTSLKNHGYTFYKNHNTNSESKMTSVYTDKDAKIKIFVSIFRDLDENPNLWACIVWAFMQKTIGQLKIYDYVDYTDKINEFIKACDKLLIEEESK